MTTWLKDKELIDNILEYNKFGCEDGTTIFSDVLLETNVYEVHISIWESEFNKTDLVVTAIKNKNGFCSLGNNKVFKVHSFDMNNSSYIDVKEEGRRLKKVLFRALKEKDIKVTSNLHYRG